jgi:hypothetical protein
MARSFKLLVVAAETQSDELTQIVAVCDGVAWELDSTLSALRKDAAGYRVLNKANPDGGGNYCKGELEKASGRAAELLAALKPAAELAAKWNAEDFAQSNTIDGEFEEVRA